MFSKNLRELTLTNRFANQAFQNIKGSSFSDDTSFVATLRAMLFPRVGDNEVCLNAKRATYSENTINNVDKMGLFNDMFGSPSVSDSLIIVNATSVSSNDRERLMQVLDDPENGLVAKYKGFTEMTNIRKFVENVMNARFYTNETTRTTLIVVELMNLRKWHYLQAFTPRYFKWYFQDNPITDEEKGLLASLIQRNPQEYEQRIEQFADKMDVRAHAVRSMLNDFERRSREAQLQAVDNEIYNCQRNIERILEEYRRQIEFMDEKKIRRAGLSTIIAEGGTSSEIVDYFLSNKSFDLIETCESHIRFIVRTYLDAFDPEMYSTIARRQQSHLFRGYDINVSAFRSIEARKKLMDAIFSDDPILRVKICAYYDVDVRGSVDSAHGFSFPSNCNDRLPNPHLQYHDCLGNHRRYICEALMNGDVIGAMEQCVSSAKSVNVGEDVTMKYFLRDLFNSNAKILVNNDGTELTPVEALEMLNKENDKPEED